MKKTHFNHLVSQSPWSILTANSLFLITRGIILTRRVGTKATATIIKKKFLEKGFCTASMTDDFCKKYTEIDNKHWLILLNPDLNPLLKGRDVQIAISITKTPLKTHNAYYLKNNTLLNGTPGLGQSGNIFYSIKYNQMDIKKINYTYNKNLAADQVFVDFVCREHNLPYFTIMIKDSETKLIQSKQCLSTQNQIDLKAKLDEWMSILDLNKKAFNMDEEIFSNNNGI